MSSYHKETKHPKTGEWEKALWLDDCFGSHNYGVIFPSDEIGRDTKEPLSAVAFDLREHDIETRENTDDGKTIETKEHTSGRKDVNVGVGTLDVKEDDPATKKAKEHIEDTVIKELANRVVTAVVVHKPTNTSTATKIKLPRVREWAEFAVNTLKSGAVRGAKREEFVVVQVDHITGDATVTTL